MFFEKIQHQEELIRDTIEKHLGKITSLEELGGGWENHTYLLNHSRVVRVCFMPRTSPAAGQARKLLEREICFANGLYQEGLNSLCYQEFGDNKPVVQLELATGDLFFLCYAVQSGSPFQVSEVSVAALAEKMATFHHFATTSATRYREIPLYDNLVSSLQGRAYRYCPDLAGQLPAYRSFYEQFVEIPSC